ncbi:hypothetical protein EZJ49_06035 [Bdellovibrio bacteriovorus]|uniref:hypothetical protein n=1 Tax=Bdellovibrio bacteriovorus TaxID=959 RepID=UPI0021D1A1BD|nr:hypothetical protein [Bdellovibrio bacteriovorus]UXR65808.1 hypothetical protein EZJ49_06035 [Bdellovibrio bacteriovorus]
MIEYTLILVITVAIVIGLTSQIIKPMQAFLDNYMGKYVQCLLEMGELPAIGSEDTTVADEGCNARFQPGTLAGGRPPRDSAGGSGSSSGKNGEGSKSSSSSDGGSGSSGGSSSGSTYAGSASRGGSRFMNRNRRPSSGVESGGGAQGKVVEIALDGGGSGSFFKGSNGANYGGAGVKRRSVAITGMTEMERKRLEKAANGEGRATMVTSESIKPPVKKLAVKPPPVQNFEREEEPFTIGNFIRIIFIAAIIIALVLLVGGQALQMSKSFEK